MILQGRFTTSNEIYTSSFKTPIFQPYESVIAFDIEDTLLQKKINGGKRITWRPSPQSYRAIDLARDAGHRVAIWSHCQEAVELLQKFGRPFTEADQYIAGYNVDFESASFFKNLAILNTLDKVVGIEDSDIFFEPPEQVIEIQDGNDLIRATIEADQILTNRKRCPDCIPLEKCQYGFCPRQLR
jgi:hypothetical protein